MALAMKAKYGEPIRVGDVLIEVKPWSANSYQICIEAPKEMKIYRLGKMIKGTKTKTTRAITPTTKEK